MMDTYLIFAGADNIQYGEFGECRVEMWQVYKNGKHTSEYVFEYYQNGHLIGKSNGFGYQQDTGIARQTRPARRGNQGANRRHGRAQGTSRT